MKIDLLKATALFACVFLALSGCDMPSGVPNTGSAIVPSDTTGGDTGDDTGDDDSGSSDEDYAPNLFVADYTYGNWEQITGGLKPDMAVADYEATCIVAPTDDGNIKVSVSDPPKAWCAGTLAQVSDPAKAKGSYYDFTAVTDITFKVRTNFTSFGDIKFKMESSTATLINEKALSTYSPTPSTPSSTEWTTVKISVSSYKTQKIVNAFCVVLTPTAGKWAEFKDIDFVDASGASVDIATKIVY